MKWMKQQLNFCTRWLPCRVSALVFCFSFALDARALTQTEVEQAVYSALTQAPLNMSGSQMNVVPWLYPSIQSMTLGEYFMYALGWQASYAQPDTLRSLLLDISLNTRTNTTDFSTILPFLESLSTNQVTSLQLAAEFNDAERYYLDYLTSLTYTGDSRLRVSDGEALLVLSNIVEKVEATSDHFDGSLQNLTSDIMPVLASILQHLDDLKETDDEIPDIVTDAEDGTSDSYDDKWNEVESEYSDTPLPEADQDEYDEVYDPSDDPDLSYVIDDLDGAPRHAAILTLHRASRDSTSLPGIEIDFGRDSAFNAFTISLDDLTNWLYPVMGVFFLSLKGVKMWRIVRTATVAATADPGSPPIVHLAWSPF